MTTRKQVITSPDPDGDGWVVQAGGTTVGKYRTKEQAEREGREVAVREKAEHVIMDGRGRISEKNSYGNDPREHKG